MAKILYTDYRTGSLRDLINNILPTYVGNIVVKRKMANGIEFKRDGNLIYNINKIVSELSIILWIRITKRPGSGVTYELIANENFEQLITLTGSMNLSAYINGGTKINYSGINDYYQKDIQLVVRFDNTNKYRVSINNKLVATGIEPTGGDIDLTNIYIASYGVNATRRAHVTYYKVEIHDSIISDDYIEKDYLDFLNSPLSKPTVPSIRDFNYPKSLDSSHLVDSKRTINLNQQFIENDTLFYTNQYRGNFIWNSEEKNATFLCNENTITTMGGRRPNYFNVGEKFKIFVRAKSSNVNSVLWATIGDSTDDYSQTTPINQPNLSPEYQIFEFEATCIDTTNDGFYITIPKNSLVAGVTEFTIDYVLIYKIQGLLSHYSFDPKTINNGVLTDVSGNGNDGTINGALNTNNGLKFDGVKDYIEIGSTSFSGKTTIAFRGYINSSGYIFGGYSDTLFARVVSNELRCMSYNSGFYGKSAVSFVPSKNIVDIIITFDGVDTSIIYINGLAPTSNIPADTSLPNNPYMIMGSTIRNSYCEGEVQDFKIYNYVFTPQEALAYHNSFRKPLLLEDFSKYPVTTKPEHWEVVSGNVEIAEEVEVLSNDAIAELGEQLRTSPITDGVGTTAGFKAYSDNIVEDIGDIVRYTEIVGDLGYIYLRKSSHLSENINIGDKIFVKIIVNPTNSMLIGLYTGQSYDYKAINAGLQEVIWECTEVTSSTIVIKFKLLAPGETIEIFDYTVKKTTTISDKLTELGIPQPTLYSRFAKWISDGVMATQSTQAYGEWNFDVYRYSSDNLLRTAFISLDNEISTNEYRIVLLNISNSIRFQVVNSGLVSNKFITANSYINNNVWYKLKIQRLQSEGKFQLIGDNITYPANTFAVFTKAEDEKEFTLVPVESGSNPVTDGTYRESKYISIDADAGDRIKSIEVYNQVKK